MEPASCRKADPVRAAALAKARGCVQWQLPASPASTGVASSRGPSGLPRMQSHMLGPPGPLAATLSHTLSPGLASSMHGVGVPLWPLLLCPSAAGRSQGPVPPPGSW